MYFKVTANTLHLNECLTACDCITLLCHLMKTSQRTRMLNCCFLSHGLFIICCCPLVRCRWIMFEYFLSCTGDGSEMHVHAVKKLDISLFTEKELTSHPSWSLARKLPVKSQRVAIKTHSFEETVGTSLYVISSARKTAVLFAPSSKVHFLVRPMCKGSVFRKGACAVSGSLSCLNCVPEGASDSTRVQLAGKLSSRAISFFCFLAFKSS